jgi:hypothetical protein
MTARTKSVLIVVVTLLVGGAVGAMITSAVFHARLQRLAKLRTPEGFVAKIEEVIVPDNDRQREQIRNTILPTALQLDDRHRVHVAETDSAVDAMTRRLEPLLSETQRTNLNNWIRDRRARERETK